MLIFVEVNVSIFADTSGQSIQMVPVSQIFLSFLFIFLFISRLFFVVVRRGGSIKGVRGPVHKVVHGPGL